MSIKSTFTAMVTAAIAAQTAGCVFQSYLPVPGGLAVIQGNGPRCDQVAALAVGLLEEADLDKLPQDLVGLSAAAIDHLEYAQLLLVDTSEANQIRPAWITPPPISEAQVKAAIGRAVLSLRNLASRKLIADTLGLRLSAVQVIAQGDGTATVFVRTHDARYTAVFTPDTGLNLTKDVPKVDVITTPAPAALAEAASPAPAAAGEGEAQKTPGA